MRDLSWLVAGAALAMSVAMGTLWLWAIRRVQMGERLRWIRAFGLAAVIVGIVALALGSGLGPRLMAGVALLVPVSFFALQLIAKLPAQRLAVHEGEPILSFSAVDSRGEPFDLATLQGSAFLLKFYRGHW